MRDATAQRFQLSRFPADRFVSSNKEVFLLAKIGKPLCVCSVFWKVILQVLDIFAEFVHSTSKVNA